MLAGQGEVAWVDVVVHPAEDDADVGRDVFEKLGTGKDMVICLNLIVGVSTLKSEAL